MNFVKKYLFFIILFFSTYSHAALITMNEAELDQIFSQPNFANLPIDIRISTATEIVFPSLLDISTDAEVAQLFNMHSGLSTVVNFYFIDTISACGGFISTSIVGCGEFPGNDFVVESSFAAGSYGSELLAHELGHNLGLDHLSGSYLMNPSLNHQTTLTSTEVATLRLSPLVQNDGQSYWININPVLIVAQATQQVPEPSTVFLLILASFLLILFKPTSIQRISAKLK